MKIYLENCTNEDSLELFVTPDEFSDGDSGLWIRISQAPEGKFVYQYEHVTIHAADEYAADRLLPWWALDDRILAILDNTF